jgi:ankyrin repeat protein
MELKKLVDKGKFTSLRSPDAEGRIAIVEAAKRGDLDCLKILGDNGNGVQDTTGMGPLHYLASTGSDECVVALLRNGADADGRNWQGDTALHCAAANGHFVVLKTLLGYSADTDAANTQGYTPLLRACKSQEVRCAMELIEAGADLNPADENSKTALMYACEFGHTDVVASLSSRGARVNVTDSGGRTAKEYAVRNNHDDCVEELPKNAKLGTLEPVGGAGGIGGGVGGGVAAPYVHVPTTDELMAKIKTLEQTLEQVTVTLAGEKQAHSKAVEEVAHLTLRLGAFELPQGDDDDVNFSSDDDASDMLDGGSEGSGSEAAVKAMRGQISTLRLENAVLKGGKGGGTSSMTVREADELKAEVITLKDKLKLVGGDMPVVPVLVVELLKEDHAQQVEALETKLAAAPKTNEDHNAQVAKWRADHATATAAHTAQLAEMQAKLVAVSKVAVAGSDVCAPNAGQTSHKIAELETKLAAATAAAVKYDGTDALLVTGAVTAQHKLELACYRQQLLLAVQGKLSDPIKAALLRVIAFNSPEGTNDTNDDDDLPSPPPQESEPI